MFTLKSPAFSSSARIPARYTCAGAGVSPPLEWRDVPEGALSLALVCEDPDAPGGTFHHWAVFDLSRNCRQLAEDISPLESLPDGARQARNDFGKPGYGAPCPPKGDGVHHYHFRLLALNVGALPVGPGVSCKKIATAARSHAIAETEMIGLCQR